MLLTCGDWATTVGWVHISLLRTRLSFTHATTHLPEFATTFCEMQRRTYAVIFACRFWCMGATSHVKTSHLPVIVCIPLRHTMNFCNRNILFLVSTTMLCCIILYSHKHKNYNSYLSAQHVTTYV